VSIMAERRENAPDGLAVGKALWGARPGDVAQVALANGRSRKLRVRDVRHAAAVARAA